ncbi:uncharacterized protein LOC131942912 [Physella acuta]|uniref:uncharacterized protein LOC131942912 n=1 Tax=Physella acuta TaxID=109671 RepID=UPI0027DE9E0E|nr:uncharacterized protein LOC131942912 [Physella acuta]
MSLVSQIAFVVFCLASVLGEASTFDCGCPLVTRYLALISGEYSNAGDVGTVGPASTQDVLYMKFQQVDVPALEPSKSLYFEEKINSVLFRREIMAVSQTSQGYIRMLPYTITLPAG